MCGSMNMASLYMLLHAMLSIAYGCLPVKYFDYTKFEYACPIDKCVYDISLKYIWLCKGGSYPPVLHWTFNGDTNQHYSRIFRLALRHLTIHPKLSDNSPILHGRHKAMKVLSCGRELSYHMVPCRKHLLHHKKRDWHWWISCEDDYSKVGWSQPILKDFATHLVFHIWPANRTSRYDGRT